MDIVKIELPNDIDKFEALNIGQRVLLSGIIYTARDQAHKRLFDLIKQDEELPFNLKDKVIYYVGPTPAPKGRVIGAAGPTTSSRMDKYTPKLIEKGLKGMIGKGNRGIEVITAIRDHGAVYFAALGGGGALISDCIISSEVIAFEDLGTEAIHKLLVKDMPVVVAIDCKGENIYETGIKDYIEKKVNI